MPLDIPVILIVGIRFVDRPGERRHVLQQFVQRRRVAVETQLREMLTAKHAPRIGRTEEILVEHGSTRDKTELVGKTDNFKKVIFKPEEGRIIKPGDYVKVKIDDIRGWTLRGTLV